MKCQSLTSKMSYFTVPLIPDILKGVIESIFPLTSYVIENFSFCIVGIKTSFMRLLLYFQLNYSDFSECANLNLSCGERFTIKRSKAKCHPMIESGSRWFRERFAIVSESTIRSGLCRTSTSSPTARIILVMPVTVIQLILIITYYVMIIWARAVFFNLKRAGNRNKNYSFKMSMFNM